MNKVIVFLISFVVQCPNTFAQSYVEIEQLLDGRNYSKAGSILKSRNAANGNDDSAYFFLGKATDSSHSGKNSRWHTSN